MNGIYVIIGGNLGNRVENLRLCRVEINRRIGPSMAVSSIYETASWGKEDEAAYLNQVLHICSNKPAIEILKIILTIEKDLGRTRNKKWEARLIDIDILFYNNEIISSNNLTIPHPHIAERKFVLVPLHEIAPNLIHPVLNLTIGKLLLQCNDNLEVIIFH